MDINQPDLERLMVIEHILMTAEGGYLKNPTDSDVSIFIFMDLCFCPIVYKSCMHYTIIVMIVPLSGYIYFYCFY